MKLLLQALLKMGAGLICLFIFLFLPAGTFDYPNGWLFVAILFIPMLCFGLVLFIKAPDLLQKRLQTNEKNADQKQVILLSTILFIIVFVLSGLDFRFQWSNLPHWVIAAASVVFLLGYSLYIETMRENAFLSRTVEIQQKQKVISTGLYSIVRHPMYFATVLVFLSMPLILGSIYAFIVIACSYPFIIAKRIKGEEQILSEGLDGYKEYMNQVKFKMIPLIW